MRKSTTITSTLTQTHYRMVMAFLDFKKRNEKHMEEREYFLTNWKLTELALAQKSPALEAEFALDERTPLGLYDCLVPALK